MAQIASTEQPRYPASEKIQISSSVVIRDCTRRADMFGYNQQQHDKLVLIVSPDCVCYLVNINKRQVYWQFKDENGKIYEPSRDEEKGVKDYLDAEVDEHGDMHIYRHTPLSEIQKLKSTDLITLHHIVGDIYGGEVTFTTSIKTLDFQHLSIKRTDHEFRMQQRWHLKLSTYKASIKKSGVKCFVYHALTQNLFTEICREFKIAKSLENIPFIQKWITQRKRIEICDPKEIVYGDLVKGTTDGEHEVAVQILEQGDDDFETIYANNAWSSCDGGKYVARLIEVEIQDGRCLLAFEPCLMTLRQYLEQQMPYKPYGPLHYQWLDLLRDLILGIRDLHQHSVRSHGNLNIGNILVSTRIDTKLSGLSECTRLIRSDPQSATQSTSKDMYALGKVLLGWYSEFNFDDLTEDDPLTHLQSIHTCPREAYEIIEKLLGPPPRPDIDEVLIHYTFWGANDRLEFVRLVSDELETMDGATHLKTPIEGLLSKLFPTGQQQDWTSASYFSPTLVTEMKKWRTYDGSKVQCLLRFMRNIISHFATIPQSERNVIGRDKIALEYTFRKKFPNLFIGVYTKVKEVLKLNPGTFPSLERYYDVHNYSKGYFR